MWRALQNADQVCSATTSKAQELEWSSGRAYSGTRAQHPVRAWTEGEAGTSWVQELPLAGSQTARRRAAAPRTCHVFAQRMFIEHLLCTKHSDVKTGRQL